MVARSSFTAGRYLIGPARIAGSILWGAALGAGRGAATSAGARTLASGAVATGRVVGYWAGAVAIGAAIGVWASGPVGATYGAVSPTLTGRQGFYLGLEGAVSAITDPRKYGSTVGEGFRIQTQKDSSLNWDAYWRNHPSGAIAG